MQNEIVSSTPALLFIDSLFHYDLASTASMLSSRYLILGVAAAVALEAAVGVPLGPCQWTCRLIWGLGLPCEPWACLPVDQLVVRPMRAQSVLDPPGPLATFSCQGLDEHHLGLTNLGLTLGLTTVYAGSGFPVARSANSRTDNFCSRPCL